MDVHRGWPAVSTVVRAARLGTVRACGSANWRGRRGPAGVSAVHPRWRQQCSWLGTRIPAGRNQLIGTAEYRYVAIPVRPFSVAGINLYAGLQVAAFADLGLAWNDDQDRRAASAIDGYGVGLRLQVPFVDLIRIDVAWGEPGQGAFAYFGVGLKAARQRQRVR